MARGGMPSGGGGGAQAALAGDVSPLAQYVTFEHVMDLIRERRDMVLRTEIETCFRLVRYSPGRIEFEPTDNAPTDLASRLAGRLQTWTGVRWGVTIAQGGGKTIAETQDAVLEARKAKARACRSWLNRATTSCSLRGSSAMVLLLLSGRQL